MGLLRGFAVVALLGVTALPPLFAQTGADEKTRYALTQYEEGNEAAAIRFLIQLAYQGNTAAQFNLGVINLGRDDTVSGEKEARFWFREAAEEGDIGAQFNLGMLLNRSEADPQQRDESLNWLLRAAEGGNLVAQTNLGIVRFLDADTERERLVARQWLMVAAESGDAMASRALSALDGQTGSEALRQLLHPLDLQLRAEVRTGASEILVGKAAIYVLPGSERNPVATLSSAARVQVVGKQNGWVEVRTNRGLPLWTSAANVEVLGEEAVVRRLEAPLYTQPEVGPDAIRVGILTKGEQMNVIRSDADWLLVEAPPRVTGWMRESDVAVKVSSRLVGLAGEGESTSATVDSQREDGSVHVLADTPIFQQPTGDAKRQGVAMAGSPVVIGKYVDGFAYSDAFTASGWMFADLIDLQAAPAADSPGSGVVNRTGARARLEPNLSAPIVARWRAGERVSFARIVDGWAQVTLSPQSGWIAESALENSPVQATTSETEAGSLIDNPSDSDVSVGENRATIPADGIVYSDATLTSRALGRLVESIQVNNPIPGSGAGVSMLPVPGSAPLYAWVFASLVSLDGAADITTGPVAARISRSGVRVRLDPATNRANVIANLDSGSPILLLGREGDWFRVQMPSAAGYAVVVLE